MAMRIEDWREIRDHYTDLDEIDEPTDAELAAIDQDLRAVDALACDERDWMLSEQMRCALADAHLATITMDAPF